MRIVTWNINGVRTLPQYHPWNSFKTFDEILCHLEADIICFQEMKITRQVLPKAIALPPSFDSFFSFPFRKSGYSGCAVYTRRTCVVPLKAEEGLTGLLQPKQPFAAEERVSQLAMYPPSVGVFIDKVGDDEDGVKQAVDYKTLDSEGRAIVLDLGLFVLINTYCPNDGTGTEERDLFKMQYHRLLQTRVESLIREGREVMVVGDLNACAAIEDHCEGQLMVEKGWADGLEGEEGFWGKESRRWMRDLITHEGDGPGDGKGMLVDIVRQFWPDRKGMYTCWNTKISARDTNYGTRIDFILVTPGLVPWIKAADIQPDIKGSDHCPVYVDFHDEIVVTTHHVGDDTTMSATPTTIKLQDVLGARPIPDTGEPADPPRIAAKYWEEYKQKLLSNFFGKKTAGSSKPTGTPKATKDLFTRKPSIESTAMSQEIASQSPSEKEEVSQVSIRETRSHPSSTSEGVPITAIAKSNTLSTAIQSAKPVPESTKTGTNTKPQCQGKASENTSTPIDVTINTSSDVSMALDIEPPPFDARYQSLQENPAAASSAEPIVVDPSSPALYQAETNAHLQSQTQTQIQMDTSTPLLQTSSSSSSFSASAPDTQRPTLSPNEPEKISKRKRDLASITVPVKKAKVSKSSSKPPSSSSSFLSEMRKESEKKNIKEKATEPKGKVKAPAQGISRSESASSSSTLASANIAPGSSTLIASPPIHVDTGYGAGAIKGADEDANADYLFALSLLQAQDAASTFDQSQSEGSSNSGKRRTDRMRSPISLPPRGNGNKIGKQNAQKFEKDKNKEQASKQAWSTLMAPIQAPLCIAHQEVTKEYTVNKQGPNKGKRFFLCSRPVGPGYDKGWSERPRDQVDPQWKCNFFKWSSEVRKEMAMKSNANSLSKPSKSGGSQSFSA